MSESPTARMDACSELDDDEVIEMAIAPVGAAVRLAGSGRCGTVGSISPGGTRMRVTFGDGEEQWLGIDDGWELAELSTMGPLDDASATIDEAGEEAEEAAGSLAEAPVLEMWRWTSNYAICGYVYGKRGYRDGELMTTSIVPPEGRFDDHVVRRM